MFEDTSFFIAYARNFEGLYYGYGYGYGLFIKLRQQFVVVWRSYICFDGGLRSYARA